MATLTGARVRSKDSLAVRVRTPTVAGCSRRSVPAFSDVWHGAASGPPVPIQAKVMINSALGVLSIPNRRAAAKRPAST